jgi:hypothetical protein
MPHEMPVSPFDELLGYTITGIGPERVTGVLPVTPKLHQPFGIVHGGVYTTVVETTASVGAMPSATASCGSRGPGSSSAGPCSCGRSASPTSVTGWSPTAGSG